MLERGAVAVLDQRIVFLSLGTADITNDAVARIDLALGDGAATAEGASPSVDPITEPTPEAAPEQ